MILRPATFADEKLLLNWRNDQTVRAVSTNTLEVSEESHKAWLLNIMRDNETQLYIAEVDGIPIGQGRIERAWKAISKKMDSCLIGYSIASEYRRQGHGVQLVTKLVNLAKNTHGYSTVSCRIKRTNMCSVAVAIKAGVHTIELF
jgi:RimJ/RimL family protein N-acetyltransferase